MARYPPKRDSPQVMIAPEPPKKKDKEEYVLVEPRDFKQAWIDVGLNQCVSFPYESYDTRQDPLRLWIRLPTQDQEQTETEKITAA